MSWELVAACYPLAVRGREAGMLSPPQAEGGENGAAPCTRHSPKHMGRGLQWHKHQPQRQQHCSQGDRKRRTRLDQSRLEQTPPTITIIHNPPLPTAPPSTAVSHIYQGKNGSKCQGFRAKNPTAGVGVEAEQHPPTHHHAAQRASRTAAWERRQTQLTYSVRCCVLVQGGYFQLGIHNQSLETAAEL